MQYDILDYPYTETVAKLTSFEAGVIADQERDSRFRAWEKETQFATKPNGGKKGGAGSDSKKKKDQDKKSSKKSSNSKPKCDYCGKKHKGECWKKAADEKEDKKKKRRATLNNDVAMCLGKLLLTNESKKKSKYDSDSESENERCYIIGRACGEQDSSDLSIESLSGITRNDRKRYKKKRIQKTSQEYETQMEQMTPGGIRFQRGRLDKRM